MIIKCFICKITLALRQLLQIDYTMYNIHPKMTLRNDPLFPKIILCIRKPQNGHMFLVGAGFYWR